MIVTAGHNFTTNEAVTSATLNAAAVPTVALENEEVQPQHLAPSVGDSLGVTRANFLRNGNFAKPLWQRGAAQVSCPVAAITYRADYWGVRPELVTSAGLPIPGTVKCERGSTGPADSPLSLDTLLLTGDSLVQSVDILQDIGAHLSYALRTAITLTCWIYNNTGASFTPTLKLDTADAEDNFSAVTERSSTAGTACPNATWSKQTWANIDLSAVTNMANGLRVRIRIPGDALSSGAKSIQLSQVKLERGATATAFLAERDERPEDLGGDAPTGVPRNFFENADFADGSWRDASVTLTENVIAGGPRGWLARCAADSGVVMAREFDGPAGVGGAVSLTGATNVTTADFGQFFERVRAVPALGTVTLKVACFNDTGAAFTPGLRIETCDAENTFGTTTNRKDQSLAECADGAWTDLEHSFDLGALTNAENGFMLWLRVPDGSMNSSGKSVLFAQPQLVLGGNAGDFAADADPQTAVVRGQTHRLVITCNSSTFQVSVDEAVLKDDSGRALLVRIAAPVTVNGAGANGAGGLDVGSLANDTWYFLWLIGNGITTSAVLSLSASAPDPTNLGGYHYKGLVGAFRRHTAGFYHARQCDDWCEVAGGKIMHGVGPSVANVWHDLDISAIVPPIAREIRGFMASTTTTGDLRMGVSQHGTYRYGRHIVNLDAAGTTWVPADFGTDQFGACAPFQLLLGEDPGKIQWISDVTTTNKALFVTGYRI